MTAEATSPEWLTLGAASRLLGVSESTIRRWADSGEVRSFRTAGGHRRVAAEDIRAILERGTRGRAPEADRIGSLALARVRRRLARTKGTPVMAHLQTLDEASRERLRLLGRQLVDLFARCIAGGSRHERFVDDARAIGREYGRVLVQAGVGIGTAVAMFNRLRRSLEETASQTASEARLSADRAVEAIEHILELADVVLEGMADLYESLFPTQAGSASSRKP